MNRIRLSLICSLAYAAVHAQAPRFYVGPFAGVNITTSDTGLGWNAGMIGLYDFSKVWEVQMQLGGLMEQNFHEQSIFLDDGSSVSATTYDAHTRRSYFEGSTLFTFNPRLGNHVNAAFGLGFTTRLLVSSSMDSKISHTGGAGTSRGSFDLMSISYRWNYYLPFQLGMNFLGRHHNWSWRLEYNLPLRNLYNPPPPPDSAFDYAYQPSNVRYKSAALKLTYLFPIRK